MIRWIFVCLLLSVCAVAAVWAITPTIPPSTSSEPPPKPDPEPPPDPQPDLPPLQPVKASRHTTSGRPVQPVLIEFAKQNREILTETIIIPNAPVVIASIQEVASEKEGILSFIGTDVQPGEVVPPEKQLPRAELGFLAVPVDMNENVPAEEKFQLYGRDYRRLRDDDELAPQKIALAREFRPVRKLQVGDHVKRNQLVGLVSPKKAFDDVTMKVAKLNAADFDKKASEKKRDEYQRRYDSMMEQNRRAPGTVPRDEWMAALLQRDNYAYEAKTKGATVVEAQRALNAALTDLRMHEIRAAIDGDVKVIYKNHQGDAVKPLEAVLQIQNPSRVRVDGLLEIQEALKLKEGMEVYIEASRPEHPKRVISGHLDTVNCVAVSKGKKPVIVSGSDDETLRGWDSATGERLWLLKDLKSAVRAVACTPPASKHNLALFGTADGMVRVLDLDNPKAGTRELNERHQQAVNGVAFSPDGEVCATCSDDQTIYLWKTESGDLLHRLPFHRGPVTSVQFASAKRLVSVGRDNKIAVWDIESGKPPHRIDPLFVGRGGEVAQLSASPDGRFMLFDQGKELRLLSLADKQIEGTLQNPSEAMNFSTMALFSPDGKTILTNASAPGKLQLWRTPASQARASELRQFIWMKGTATCGAFAPEDGSFAVTGTQDHQVLVWSMPGKEEVESRLKAQLTLVEKNLDTQSRQVRVWAELNSPEWLFPGMRATMVVPPQKIK
ncbi:MAG TPA: HlyD family efflux transporter periplasmic adaptor subunit [Gemmataceae bacterium]|jgi:WD40 repeat protein